ncbi:hypothetical protein BJ742DRAFT_898773 [Cladochytrium replicatum]|nr:hypothetical protein BJ742DRAFT_898773 [Cladochytrium replicatum]
METRSKKQSQSDESSQNESRQQQQQERRRLSRSVRNDKGNGSSISFAAVIAIALLIGSAGYYFQQENHGSSVGLLRASRSPAQTNFAVGDSCDPTIIHSVCLHDEGDGYAFCGAERKIVRGGNSPPGQKCVDTGKGNINFVAIPQVSPSPSPPLQNPVGTILAYRDCDPSTVNTICLSLTEWGQCQYNGKIMHMGSMAPGTKCSYSFLGGVTRIIPVPDSVTNLRNYDANNRIWWQLNMAYSSRHFTLRPGAECGSVGTTLCFGPNTALLCNYSGKVWEPKTCSSCTEQDVTKPFVKDTCNP